MLGCLVNDCLTGTGLHGIIGLIRTDGLSP